MVRPGKSYRLIEDFARAGALAPDVPLLSVPDDKRVEDVDDLDNQIRRGKAFRDWEATPVARRGEPPSRAAGDYVLVENGGHHRRNINTAVEILEALPAGALVFVPAAGLADRALMGELAPADEERVTFVTQRCVCIAGFEDETKQYFG
jgi:hypothetical protein